MFAQTAVAFLAVAASLVSALPQQPSPVDTAPLAKRTTHTGIATVYDQGGGYGSCGAKHSDNDLIVAIKPFWQGYGAHPKYCGRKIKMTNTGSNDGVGGKGRTVVATIVDTCPGCATDDSIDLSHGAWNQLTNHAAPGTANIKWSFCSADGKC